MKDDFEREVSYCIFCKADTPHVQNECIVCKEEQEKKVVYSQVWSCTECKETGAIEYAEDESPERVMNKIVEDHARRTVLCPGGVHSIMVHPPIDTVN